MQTRLMFGAICGKLAAAGQNCKVAQNLQPFIFGLILQRAKNTAAKCHFLTNRHCIMSKLNCTAVVPKKGIYEMHTVGPCERHPHLRSGEYSRATES